MFAHHPGHEELCQVGHLWMLKRSLESSKLLQAPVTFRPRTTLGWGKRCPVSPGATTGFLQIASVHFHNAEDDTLSWICMHEFL